MDKIAENLLNEQARIERAKEKLNKVLEEEDCIAFPVFTISPKGIKGEIQFLPKPRIIPV